VDAGLGGTHAVEGGAFGTRVSVELPPAAEAAKP
jgi:hypothetical protein